MAGYSSSRRWTLRWPYGRCRRCSLRRRKSSSRCIIMLVLTIRPGSLFLYGLLLMLTMPLYRNVSLPASLHLKRTNFRITFTRQDKTNLTEFRLQKRRIHGTGPTRHSHTSSPSSFSSQLSPGVSHTDRVSARSSVSACPLSSYTLSARRS